MDHSEFLEKYRVGEGNFCRYVIDGVPVAKNFLKSALKRKGLTVESWYLKCRGLDERPKCVCGEETHFLKLRDGYSSHCSQSCRSRTTALEQWSGEGYEKMKSATAHALVGRRGNLNSPKLRFKKNLYQFRNHPEIYLYVIGNEVIFKFGVTCNESRLESLSDLLNSTFKKVLKLETELACKIEADLITVGEPREVEVGPRMGRTEFRDSRYLDEVLRFIDKRVDHGKE